MRKKRHPDPGGVDYIVSRLPSLELISLDVFDTLLTRTCGPPEALYLWLGRRLARRGLILQSPEVFARVRHESELQVWQREGGLDARVTLDDFYMEVARRLWIPHDVIPNLVAEELALERGVLTPTTQARQIIEHVRLNRVRPVFLSDTYFPSDFIEELLKLHGVWTEGAQCVASTDHDGSKATGVLFATLKTGWTDVARRSILHAGDNPHSDVKMAQKNGIEAVWLQNGRLNRFEQLLAEQRWATGGLSSALAGASRAARDPVSPGFATERALREVAAGVAAPSLIGYTLWVIWRAIDLGIRRLCFLARDGQVMYMVAQILVRRLDLDLDLRYLYVSRKAVNFAATLEANRDEFAWVYRDREFLSPKEFVSKLGLSWDEAVHAAKDLRGEEETQSTSTEVANKLFDLLEITEIRQRVLERAANQRTIVQEYLSEAGVMDGTRCGLVDFGGVGSQMSALHRIFTQSREPNPSLFLVGLDSLEDAGLSPPNAAEPWLEDVHCYLYDHRRKLGVKRPRGFGTCMQMFCAADHGTVTSYAREAGPTVPVLDPAEDTAILEWGLRTVQDAIRIVAETVELDPELVDVKADLRPASCELIRIFWSHPTEQEAHAWGQFPFEGAQTVGTTRHGLAYAYTWGSVARKILERSFPNLGWQHWYEGSVALSRRDLALTLGAAEWLFRTLERGNGKLALSIKRMVKGRR